MSDAFRGRAHGLRGECGRGQSASSLEARAVVPPRSGPGTAELLLEELWVGTLAYLRALRGLRLRRRQHAPELLPQFQHDLPEPDDLHHA
jgi:hypothetical protein